MSFSGQLSDAKVANGGISVNDDFWISLIPSDPSVKAAWGQSGAQGTVAKSITAGTRWDQMGSPFSDVFQPGIIGGGSKVSGEIIFENYTDGSSLSGA